ncbi:MAG TPA: PQQ-dependent sugar dehydrogenase [Candidatus Sulfotelmatobacter sp.]|jgi:glucose/arabinose dehydrogenase|nr:PQQ-dependent sugar dehydrogenase [Candidatus Sulfotelmatobacter sp.]
MRLSVTQWCLAVIVSVLPFVILEAADNPFHGAPASAKTTKNPLAGQQAAIDAGKTVYARNCLSCHGKTLKGTGNVPSLIDGKLKGVTEGEIFWFVTKGDKDNGMPSWAFMPEEKRWQVVSYLEAVLSGKATAAGSSAAPAAASSKSELKDASPNAPFTDYRYEKPGTVRKISVSDLPKPFATQSAQNGADVVSRPENAWPVAPAGFKVELFAAGLENPRLLRTAPNGDVFLAESEAGRIRVFRGVTSDGKAEQSAIFASGLKRPYGIAFYPAGPDPQWVYIGNTNEVVRFAYHNGDLKASGGPEHVADLPSGEGHWTRALDFSKDGKKLFVAVGSASNVDDPDTHPGEKDRADILVCDPANCTLSVYAYGIRNAGGGIRVSPQTGELWCSVNERDALGDNLVPDYITHVQEGGFYGWPWWYMGTHQDPRHEGKHPELKDKVIVPDVLLQPHNASLEFTFYEADKFPAEYKGDIFASEHGSWNKATRVGYEVIRVPLHQTGHASGEYEDFLTGFVRPNGQVWGRPVGITLAPDGSLLVSDDGSNSIWRVSYTGK